VEKLFIVEKRLRLGRTYDFFVATAAIVIDYFFVDSGKNLKVLCDLAYRDFSKTLPPPNLPLGRGRDLTPYFLQSGNLISSPAKGRVRVG
jgi:hypothetical protein